MNDKRTYLANAATARAEADAAVLDNVRERCLRSEAAWNAMAERLQFTEDLRAKRLAAEASEAPPEDTADPQEGIE